MKAVFVAGSHQAMLLLQQPSRVIRQRLYIGHV